MLRIILSVTFFAVGQQDEDPPSFRDLFKRMPGVRLSAIIGTHIPKSNVEDCARRCVSNSEFNCKSFDFDSQLKVRKHVKYDSYKIS